MPATSALPTVWRLLPAAKPDDPTWEGRPIFSEVIVRAPTSAQARVEAAKLARDPDDVFASLEKADPDGGFTNEKLYRVVPVPPEEAGEFGEGEPGVVRSVPAGISGA